MRPACLDHADFGVCEVADDRTENGGWRDEVGIEDGDKFAGCGIEALFESARFVADAVAAEAVCNVVAKLAHFGTDCGADLGAFIDGIVEDLNLQAIGGIVQSTGCFDDAAGYWCFVEHGELDGD